MSQSMQISSKAELHHFPISTRRKIQQFIRSYGNGDCFFVAFMGNCLEFLIASQKVTPFN